MKTGIRGFLLKWFQEHTWADEETLKNGIDENYFVSGWIDSFDFVELIAALEEQFDIRFDAEDYRENQCVATITGLSKIVERKMQQ